jgi:hypothetical protein
MPQSMKQKANHITCMLIILQAIQVQESSKKTFCILVCICLMF